MTFKEQIKNMTDRILNGDKSINVIDIVKLIKKKKNK